MHCKFVEEYYPVVKESLYRHVFCINCNLALFNPKTDNKNVFFVKKNTLKGDAKNVFMEELTTITLNAKKRCTTSRIR